MMAFDLGPGHSVFIRISGSPARVLQRTPCKGLIRVCLTVVDNSMVVFSVIKIEREDT